MKNVYLLLCGIFLLAATNPHQTNPQKLALIIAIGTYDSHRLEIDQLFNDINT
jgi:hypothetical protein